MEPALAQFSPDIVHAHGLWLYFATAAIRHKRRTGTPYLVSPHGMLAGAALNIKSWRKRLARLLYQDRLLEQSDCLVATSESELEHIRSAGLYGAVAIIPLGIEDASPVPSFSDKADKRVIYLGRKLALKGLEELSLAWNDIAGRFPDWRLQIIGPDTGGYEAELSAMIARQDIPRLELLPPVYGSARDAAYSAAQLTVLPSVTENFALTVGESLVRGIPVIATRATPWAGLETNACGIWTDGDRASIAAAMAQIMALPAIERYEMGRRGREWILRDYQWPVLAERHHKLYRWILGREARPEFVVED
jgi:glycosyltransferase involved in cell wall biosynthesis